ncbi:MAG: excinuclease ABC subunit UvrA [Bacteroidetes bacterium]|nr:excinuclease ABC subunit UvrA [Bacteroidota bacterium]
MTIQGAALDELDPREYIIISKARVNNLRNLSVAIPRNKLVVVSGLSGSGKSSLAFDTLFAEGQRMYVESLSSYARQFLGRMEKPDVDYIRGVSPAIAIEQKVNTRNPRSTVGTTTEIYDYLKLLFARVGKTYAPETGKEVRRDSVTDVVNAVIALNEGTRITITCPLKPVQGRSMQDELKVLLSKGFARILKEGKVEFIEELLKSTETPKRKSAKAKQETPVEVLIDRTAVKKDDEEFIFRLSDSVQTAFYEGHGDCIIHVENSGTLQFSDRFESDGVTFTEPSVNFFSFNNPYGACTTCEGFGKILGIDEELVVPDKSRSLFDGCVAPWRSEVMGEWAKPWLKRGIDFGFPIHRPYNELSAAHRKLLWDGNRELKGIHQFFRHLESKMHKIQYRVMLSRYRGRTTCPDCRGTRLRKDASYVKISNTSITDICLLPIGQVLEFFKKLQLPDFDKKVSERLLTEIVTRLDYLNKVGLGYLTLNRLTSSLSGGEYQRIKLATSLGSALVGSMYILDEPSIGLHPRDTGKMVEVLLSLRDLGNTVIVVEHEEAIMRAADELIDIGPDAGRHGGELVYQGIVPKRASKISPSNNRSYTLKFLSGEDSVAVPTVRRKWNNSVVLHGVRENNLKNLTVEFPLGVLCVVTGVSGSGKSTLIRKVLYPALGRATGTGTEYPGKFDSLDGEVRQIGLVEFVDQNPIGKSSRSNPVSYIKAYDAIRQFFAELPLSKTRSYKPSHFSFNVEGGRCETCEGEGVTTVEMQFMADIHLTCESCGGKRFKQEILEVEYHGKNISDILAMTVEESLEFFADRKTIHDRISPLAEVGLGYVQLGQSSSSLSGGEAQRVKLASFLGKNSPAEKNVLFIFDEPTTGLHFHDIGKLMKAIQALVDRGHSVIIIEHNLEVIKCADWIIDLGPEGGDAEGGFVVAQGTPEAVVKKGKGYTAKFLKEKLS